MSNGADALRGFVYQFYWSIHRCLEAVVRVEQSLTSEEEPDACVMVLEGATDITEVSAADVTYIQVKSRERGAHTWTLTELANEVLVPLASIENRTSGRHEYVFVTDGDFDSNSQGLAGLARRLSERVPYGADDATWGEVVESLEPSGSVISTAEARVWGGQALQCEVEALPRWLADLKVFRKLETAGQVAWFLSAIQLVGKHSLEALQARARAELRKRVPAERVEGYENRLLGVALKYSSLDAGTEFTAATLLEEAGLAGEEFNWGVIVEKSPALLLHRTRTLVGAQEPQYAIREDAHNAFRTFLASDRRIFAIVGPGRAGKTRLICELARQECAGQTIVYLDKARSFRLQRVGHDLCSLLGHEADTRLGGRELLLRIAGQTGGETVAAVFIDALDEAEAAQIRPQLDDLWELTRSIPLKVCVTCRSLEWARISRALADARDLVSGADSEPNAPSALGASAQVPCFVLGRFTDAELVAALRINVGSDVVAGIVDRPHVPDELKEILRAPAFFGLYCSMSAVARRRVTSGHAVSFVELTEAYWDDTLGRLAAGLGLRRRAVEECVVNLAGYIRVAGDAERAVAVDVLRDQQFAVPMDVDSRDSGTGMYAALVSAGMLEELPDEAAGERVRFAHGAMLDHALMVALAPGMPADVRDGNAVEEWARGVLPGGAERGLDVLLGALALLLQRLALHGHDEAARALTRAVLRRWWLEPTGFFSYVGEFAWMSETEGRVLHRIKSGLSQAWGAAGELQHLGEAWSVRETDPEQAGALAGDILDGLSQVRREIEWYELLREAPSERTLDQQRHPLRLLLERAASRFERMARECNVQIRMHVGEPANPYVLVDWDLMAHVLDALLDNAIKYSARGRPGRPRSIMVWWKQADPGKDMHVYVEGFGVQIDPSDRARIFGPGEIGSIRDPRRCIPGSGLGLAVAKKIVTQHGGNIDVWCELFDPGFTCPPPPKVPMGRVRFQFSLPVG